MESAVQGPTDPTKQHQDETIVKPEPSGFGAHSNGGGHTTQFYIKLT